jgi:phosphonate transport system substrate-binding protein
VSLRLVTYLVPGLPVELFELAAASFGPRTELVVDDRASGPPLGEPDPFTLGTVDVGFLCAPSYLRLRRAGAPVELLGVAPVFADPRAGRRPVYFADLVVRADSAAVRLEDLAGTRFGFNDELSLSGLLAMRLRLAELGRDGSFFGELVPTGSHEASVRALLDGRIDAACLDSTIRWLRRDDPAWSGVLRLVEALGPHPIQPVVVHSAMPPAERSRLVDRLIGLTRSPPARAMLASLGCVGFGAVDPADYAHLDTRLQRAIVHQGPSSL